MNPFIFLKFSKLETDQSILASKVYKALSTYRHQLVIGNLLQTYKIQVLLFDQEKKDPLSLERSPSDIEKGIDLEYYIVKEISIRHNKFLENKRE